jgi:hypothetical protein
MRAFFITMSAKCSLSFQFPDGQFPSALTVLLTPVSRREFPDCSGRVDQKNCAIVFSYRHARSCWSVFIQTRSFLEPRRSDGGFAKVGFRA